jgi:nucleotide-binding universal stress UspA family protein
MRSLARILLPVDFSERSAAAAGYATVLANHFHSELVLLHVLTPPQFEFGALDISGSMLAELYRDRAAQASGEINAFLKDGLPGLDVRRIVIEGDPAMKIVEIAHNEQAGLIVMPTHGYGPFRRFILGSNTAKVLHDADCPVWTGVHLDTAPTSVAIPFRSILCALDLGVQSAKTLEWAAWLAKEFGSRLTVAHATSSAPDLGDDPQWQWRTETRAAAGRELFRLLDSAGAEAELVIEAGDPVTLICTTAANVQADALIIGRGSAAGVFGRLRTNAYAIIRQSPCPVISV